MPKDFAYLLVSRVTGHVPRARSSGIWAVARRLVVMYSLAVKKRKSQQVEPLPRSAFFIIAVLAVVLLGLVLAGGKFFLANWRGNFVFLPVVLFLGLLLIAAVIRQFLKKN